MVEIRVGPDLSYFRILINLSQKKLPIVRAYT